MRFTIILSEEQLKELLSDSPGAEERVVKEIKEQVAAKSGKVARDIKRSAELRKRLLE